MDLLLQDLHSGVKGCLPFSRAQQHLLALLQLSLRILALHSHTLEMMSQQLGFTQLLKQFLYLPFVVFALFDLAVVLCLKVLQVLVFL